MTATTTPTLTSAHNKATPSLRRTTLVVGLAAAAATTAIAAALRAAGVSFDVDGEIPLLGFAQLTAVGAVIGGVIAAILRRFSDVPARRFVQVTAALVALSCVPSVAMPEDMATKISLVALHLVAAAIIVPVLTRQLTD